jgi:hypothetical protein
MADAEVDMIDRDGTMHGWNKCPERQNPYRVLCAGYPV